MTKIDYKKLPEEELNEKIKEFHLRVTSSYGIEPKEKKENRKRLRREIARIETELSRRKNG